MSYVENDNATGNAKTNSDQDQNHIKHTEYIETREKHLASAEKIIALLGDDRSTAAERSRLPLKMLIATLSVEIASTKKKLQRKS